MNTEERLKKANSWVYEAQFAAREARAEMWRDQEMYDGGPAAWTQDAWNNAVSAGITPLTINRTFPTTNSMIGSQIVNRFETIAKGRTKEDSETGKTMTEAIKFVHDQYGGEFLISQAFGDAVIPGLGCLAPSFNPDPREEKLCLRYWPWTETWCDPFGPIWWHPQRSRYVFRQRWMDIEDLQALFDNKKKEIENAYLDLSGEWRNSSYSPLITDEAQMIEEKIRTLAGTDWVDTQRKRVRPVEMWYPVNEMAMFALFPDGRCFEIKDSTDPRTAYQMIVSSQQVLKSVVKKMRVMTFLGDKLMLQDEPTPYAHDMFPVVPFVGYVDRYGFPYGIPRQIRGQAEEINYSRSMALAMLQKRRVIAEKGVVKDGDKDSLDNLYVEANKIDGFMVIEKGQMNAFKIEEMAQWSQYQNVRMQQSELEVREISGFNAANLGYEQPQQSGVAKTLDIQRSNVTTAKLLDNLRRSLQLVSEQTTSNIQSNWTQEKILRVTDRLTGAERFVKINEKGPDGTIVMNNITQGKYDIVVTEAPISDTMREKNMDLLYAAIEKSPPEAVPTLLIAAFEMSDLPNKEQLIEKLKPILGVETTDDNISPEEAKAMALEALKAQKQQQAVMAQIEMEAIKTKLNESKLKNLELEAKIEKLEADTKKVVVDTVIAADQHEIDIEKAGIDAMGKGIDIAQKLSGGNGNKSKEGRTMNA